MAPNIGDITFFFGAGASAPFGIPTMQKLTEEFINTISGEQLQLYKEIRDILIGEVDEKNVDIESIFSVIEGLKNYDRDHIGDLAIYASKKAYPDKSLLKLDITRTNSDVITLLEKSYQKFIREKCRIKPENRKKLFDVYGNFFTGAERFRAGYAGANNIPFSPGWTFFTTNYDRCLEVFWREHVNIDIHTGFNRSVSRNILEVENLLRHSQIAVPDLIKLHGSTNWLRHKESGQIEEKEYDIDQASFLGAVGYESDVIIFPLSQKALYFEPYIPMFYRLNKELQRTRVWIVIGYSFRDPVIRDIFVTQSSPDKKLVLLHPHSSEIITLLNGSGCKAQIIDNHYRFGGDADYRSVNAAIWESVMR